MGCTFRGFSTGGGSGWGGSTTWFSTTGVVSGGCCVVFPGACSCPPSFRDEPVQDTRKTIATKKKMHLTGFMNVKTIRLFSRFLAVFVLRSFYQRYVASQLHPVSKPL